MDVVGAEVPRPAWGGRYAQQVWAKKHTSVKRTHQAWAMPWAAQMGPASALAQQRVNCGRSLCGDNAPAVGEALGLGVGCGVGLLVGNDVGADVGAATAREFISACARPDRSTPRSDLRCIFRWAAAALSPMCYSMSLT